MEATREPSAVRGARCIVWRLTRTRHFPLHPLGTIMLLMRRCYFDAIRTGTKTTTLRFWRRPRVRAGSVHLVPGLGRVRITRAEATRIEDLVEADARADGFGSLPALRRALENLYPSRSRGDRSLYLVRFQFLAPADHPPILDVSVSRGHGSPGNNTVK